MTLRERIDTLATEARATVKVNQFDGGLIFTITAPGIGAVATTAEWGDDDDLVIEDLKGRMSRAGMLEPKHEFLLDYGSGRTARIWAPSERSAVRLAAQGEPESITDLTTGESKAWVVV